MNTLAARPKTGFTFMLIVKGGPDKGISYQLLPPKVTIGRDATSNIALSDPRVSRHAAVIEFSMERIVITDVAVRKTLVVNGVPTANAEIIDGSTIQIGDTRFVFVVEAMDLGPMVNPTSNPSPKQFADPTMNPRSGFPPLQAVPPKGSPQSTQHVSPPSPQFGTGGNGANGFSNSTRTPPSPGLSPTFKIIVGLVVAFVLYVGLAEKTKQAARKGITTTIDIQKDIDNSEKLQEDVKKKRRFSSDEEKTRYEEANRHYLEGFRDYQNLQYSRALRSFETALAIDPNNELARRYYNLAQKQRDDMVASLILEGRTYKDKLMYTRCSAAIEKALDYMSNKDDLKYKQAESMKKECDLLSDPRN